MSEPREDVLLTVKEYAALAGRGLRSVYQAMHAGRLPGSLDRPRGEGYRIRVPGAEYARLTQKAHAA